MSFHIFYSLVLTSSNSEQCNYQKEDNVGNLISHTVCRLLNPVCFFFIFYFFLGGGGNLVVSFSIAKLTPSQIFPVLMMK